MDKDGVVVLRADDLVEFSAAGPGVITAVDNGDNDSSELFQTSKRHAFHGACTAFVRATSASGEIIVTASAPGLKPARLTLRPDASRERKFSFGTNALKGFTAVAPGQMYSTAKGFGFEPSTNVGPALFSVRLPEGNHRVAITFGGADASTNTVKAEARRLIIENTVTKKRKTAERAFIVNTRVPEFPGGKVKLKPRERDSEMVSWDDRLTLEFNGAQPCVVSLVITPAPDAPTVFLAGDSTVCDQPREPWNSWGQMLPRFFDDRIAVANFANSGESIKSSLGAKRFDKIFSQMRTNDWLLLQFGHNDMKDKATNALAVYKSNLKKIVAQTRKLGGTPVLVTSMERKGGLAGSTLKGYPDTVREVAREVGVALIDLNAMSLVFYRALGAKLDVAFQDATHHNNYGSYELARCVVEGIRANVPGLRKFLAKDAKRFDPAHPDDPEKFRMAESPMRDTTKPEGN